MTIKIDIEKHLLETCDDISFEKNGKIIELDQKAIKTLGIYPSMYGGLPIYPMIMFDWALLSETGGKYNKGYVEASLDISPSAWWFHCHFFYDPVMPGCLGLDGMWQILGAWMICKGYRGYSRALGVDSVKFKGEVTRKTSKITYKLDIKGSRGNVSTLAIAFGDATLSNDTKEIYVAKGLKVGTFHKIGDKE